MSLDANQIATKGDLDALFSRFTQLLSQAAPAAAPSDEYLTLEEVATATRVSVRTVKKWVTEGKYDPKGHRITLYALEFTPGILRIPRAALLAYGQAIGFTIADLKTAPPMRIAS
ncbi:helix-turn-helix transcriptional regulator [uncultured Hymenobacter sp.]|uniref:helix-turn-helix transcriptional regulator n=1 Tax=uncultured Hymenobacter sp. TaxID=170016 RepID=UPI0035C9E459